jgi:uncharacterized protein
MWRRLGQIILSYRLPLLFLLLAGTAGMGYFASKLQLSYEFTRAIPTDNPKYLAYQEFKKKFGEDGNLLVIGTQTDKLFVQSNFNTYTGLAESLKKVEGVEDVVGVSSAVNLVKVQDGESEKLKAEIIFPTTKLTQNEIDSCANIFLNLPFYRGLIHNPATNAWLMGVRINKDILNSKRRETVIAKIADAVNAVENKTDLRFHVSGLPLIRTQIATRIAGEMKWFLIASVILSALILLIFFRSLTAMWLSLAVVIIGVVWSLGTMHLLGYKITILTALIPPLIVVIGIPNCIYFLNKYHTSYNDTEGPANTARVKNALIEMVERMGIVTLFCNVAAAIGFTVFAFTRSAVLKEFGLVSGINIMILFVISLILIPAVLSYLPGPKTRHTKYLDSLSLNRWLDRLERWSLNHRKFIYVTTVVIVAISAVGLFKLKSVGFIVDDLPKTDKIYTDLKFFEKHFKGVMPLEIIVDTKQKNGLRKNALFTFKNIDSLSQYITAQPEMARPLSIVEGMKFAKQAFFEGDSMSYGVPDEYIMPALNEYFNFKKDTSTGTKNSFSKLIASFIDSSKQQARISVNMADVGSKRLPEIIDTLQLRVNQLFAKDKYDVQFTGSSVTFLEGSRYIIKGLRESIAWAFLLIALCMLYLFRSLRILLCSLIPNIIPLLITAGVMGWVGIPLKPSTVLVFSVALGIAIDVTIRFLVNYKQELPRQNYDMKQTVIETIHSTGISIIFTSFTLIAGFIIFSFSSFGGTQALGWLTSLTLVTATFTNLVLLPAILISWVKFRK